VAAKRALGDTSWTDWYARSTTFLVEKRGGNAPGSGGIACSGQSICRLGLNAIASPLPGRPLFQRPMALTPTYD